MKFIYIFLASVLSFPALADEITVTMREALPTGHGKKLGVVTISETPAGLKFTPRLSGLRPGAHGFHIHENGNCAPGMENGVTVAALAAGGHYDPDHTGRHLGPKGPGHRGDLPALIADRRGNAARAVVAPRLKSLREIEARALVVHVGGDNGSDRPKPLGGGGARLACGVIL